MRTRSLPLRRQRSSLEEPPPAAEVVCVHRGDALDLYASWEPPVVIVSYGLGGRGVVGLPGWYEPHVRAWAAAATPLTTLWFWNTELGWATVHPVLARHGWVTS